MKTYKNLSLVVLLMFFLAGCKGMDGQGFLPSVPGDCCDNESLHLPQDCTTKDYPQCHNH